MMEKLIDLYKKWAGEEPADVIKLAGQGVTGSISVSSGKMVIRWLVWLEPVRDEDHAFVYLAQHFQLRQLPVPRFWRWAMMNSAIFRQTLAVLRFSMPSRADVDAGGRYNQKEKELLKKTIRELTNIQIRGARGLDWQNCYPQPEFDVDSVLFDLNYFKILFPEAYRFGFPRAETWSQFPAVCQGSDIRTDGLFPYRDFQARNIMLDDKGNPYFIDFQGGRKGPFSYDLAFIPLAGIC